jgi:hypothetical protein
VRSVLEFLAPRQPKAAAARPEEFYDMSFSQEDRAERLSQFDRREEIARKEKSHKPDEFMDPSFIAELDKGGSSSGCPASVSRQRGADDQES